MTETAIFFVITTAFWVVYWAVTKIRLLDSMDKQLELQDELEIMRVKCDALNVKIKKKKELLEIQDVLLKENNIKH